MQQEIQNAYETLINGGIILYPTDTIWGIGCDATHSDAVKKVYALKNRAESKSMIVLVNNEQMLYKHFSEIPETAIQIWELANRPTTLILEKPKNLAPEIIAPDNSVGVRICKEPFCYKLIERLKRPLVSTSANLSGLPSPTKYADIVPEIVNGVDYVVQLHQEKIMNLPSTIIKLNLNGEIKILRK